MTGAPELEPEHETASTWLDRLPAVALGVALVVVALAVYWIPGYDRFYNHFVLQAQSFLHGQAAIPTPKFQDVLPILGSDGQPTGFGLLPFPPLPAVVLMPFVAIWGLDTNERVVSVILGAIAVGLAWWALGFLRISRPIRLATTVFFGFGTVFWYAAQIGDTWFFAHVVAITCLLLAVGLALKSDPGADDEVDGGVSLGGLTRSLAGALRSPGSVLDGRQVLAGFLFGLACTARLTIVFGAPFFMLVGSGGSWVRRSVSAGLGAAIPVGLLLAYNVATTGHLLHPGYEYLYRLEANGYPGLHYNPAWSIEDVRYLPQNIGIMFGSMPALFPDAVPSSLGGGAPLCVDPGAVRGIFDQACPIAMPRDIGMSVILTSPAYLLVAAAFRGRSRLVAGAFLATLAIAFVNLMHFSQGWVQFGYRFSNDFVVFALVLVAIGMERRGRVGWLGIGLVVASIAINAWGVAWGNIQGW
ncbi:MAG TPA: hypothetical protein VF484_01280 [Candidatus Limnocylindrales bacterium]